MSRRKLELIDQRKRLDDAIAEARHAIDGHARGCRYADLATVAAPLVKHAQAAVGCHAELNKLVEEEWAQRRR